MKLPKIKFVWTRTFEWRPEKFPCWIVYEKTIWYFLWIPIKKKLVKIK